MQIIKRTNLKMLMRLVLMNILVIKIYSKRARNKILVDRYGLPIVNEKSISSTSSNEFDKKKTKKKPKHKKDRSKKIDKDGSFNGAQNITTENTAVEEASEMLDEVLSSSNERNHKVIKPIKSTLKDY